ncbi:MAG: pirin family protein [Gammaproteobacteria bacterium]|nr:MAG: pirin family protein [Gammaproteobacteria bacterium]
MNNRIMDSVRMNEGDGAKVRRLFPFDRHVLAADPFVLWDDFMIKPGAGFPAHAHRGFEAITYLFNGTMEHADNLGNRSTVTNGGAQRFTAGKGIQHSEMPGSDGETTGIQLWINLPRRLKDIEPDYQQVDAKDIPVIEEDGVVIRQIVGNQSPLQLHSAVEYADLQITAGTEHAVSIKTSMQGVIYVHDGNVSILGETVHAGQAYFVSGEDNIIVKTDTNSRLLTAFGIPHNESVHLTGGFVD